MNKLFSFLHFATLLCVLTILSGFNATVFSAKAEAANQTISDSDLLVELDILNPDYVMDNDKMLTRAEFIAVAMSLCKIDSGDITQVYFNDVPYNHTYAYEINKAYQLGYVGGYDDGNFRPDDNITPEHASAILMKIIHYEKLVDIVGDSITTAYRYGFLDGVSTNEGMTFGDAVKFIRNILESEPVSIDALGYPGTTITNSGDGTEHFLDKLFDIYIKVGTVEAVGNMSYIDGKTSGEGNVIISGDEYLIGTLDLKPYMGNKVTYYYKDDNDSQEIKVVLAKYDNENITVESNDIGTVKKDGSDYIVTYDNGAKEVKINVSGYYDCIYNGTFYKDFDIEKITDLFTGDIKFISRGDKNDSKYNLLIINEYRTAILEDVNYTEKILYFTDKTLFGKRTEKFAMPMEYDVYDGKGMKIVFDNLKSGYVAMIAENSEGDYAEIIASNSLQPYTIKGFSADDSTVTLDDKTYNLNRDFSYDTNRFVYGEILPIYFDAKGNMVAIEDGSVPSEHYGYLLYGYQSEDGDEVSFVLIDEDGDKVTFKLNDKVGINTDKCKKEDILKNPDLFANNKAIAQLIKYRSSNDKIKDIYTATDNSVDTDYVGFDEDNFTCDYYKETNVFIRYNPKVIDNKYLMDMNTTVFIIPSDIKQTDKFDVVRLDYFQLDYSDLANVRVYDSDGCKSARVVTLSADSVSLQRELFVLEKAVTTVEEETNEVVTKLYGYYGGKYTEFTMDEDVKLEADKGDCMTLTLEKGKVISYEILASAAMKSNIIEKNITSTSGYNGNWVIALGNVYKKSAGSLTLKYGDQLSKIAFPVLSSCYIYKFDTKSETVSVVDYNEITTDSRVFIHRASDQAKSIVLYE